MSSAMITRAARYTARTDRSGTLQHVNEVLVVGMGVAGLAVGGVLDPFGQRMAERSRADEQRRRMAGEAESAGQELPPGEVASRTSDAADATGVADVPHLVVHGSSTIRTASAAILTGGLFVGLAVHFGADLVVAPFAVFFATLVVVSLTDLSYRLVPRWLIYGSSVVIAPLLVASAGVDHRWGHLSGAAIGALAAFAAFFAVWWFVPRGMGYGDVRLSGLIGMSTGYLSLVHTYLAFLSGFVVGLVFGVVMMGILGSGRKTRIPFAPALAVGAVVAVFFGSHLAQSFFGTGS
jgi:leader peptidase (prepilin peptidase)/N-methyltransferase